MARQVHQEPTAGVAVLNRLECEHVCDKSRRRNRADAGHAPHRAWLADWGLDGMGTQLGP